MKSALALLFLLVICGNSIAQSNENYRTRNYKLNRNYLKSINTKKHQVAVCQSKEINPDESRLRKNHRLVKSSRSNKLVMKFDNRKNREEARSDFRNQKSTLRDSNKKSGKRLINYFTMVLALSLILVIK